MIHHAHCALHAYVNNLIDIIRSINVITRY